MFFGVSLAGLWHLGLRPSTASFGWLGSTLVGAPVLVVAWAARAVVVVSFGSNTRAKKTKNKFVNSLGFFPFFSRMSLMILVAQAKYRGSRAHVGFFHAIMPHCEPQHRIPVVALRLRFILLVNLSCASVAFPSRLATHSFPTPCFHTTPTVMSKQQTSDPNSLDNFDASGEGAAPNQSPFQATTSSTARSLTDCASLFSGRNGASMPVLMPWVGFGTYRLGARTSFSSTLMALRCGFRLIGETTEGEVGKAIGTALEDGTVQRREDVFVTTKQWRNFHGYEASLECLSRSLERLGLDYVDLWLVHWPGSAWHK